MSESLRDLLALAAWFAYFFLLMLVMYLVCAGVARGLAEMAAAAGVEDVTPF